MRVGDQQVFELVDRFAESNSVVLRIGPEVNLVPHVRRPVVTKIDARRRPRAQTPTAFSTRRDTAAAIAEKEVSGPSPEATNIGLKIFINAEALFSRKQIQTDVKTILFDV